MSYSTNMAGLDLFTAPFRSAQASSAAAASRPQQPKATASQPKSAVSPQQQATGNCKADGMRTSPAPWAEKLDTQIRYACVFLL